MNTVTNIGVGLTTQASNTNWTQQAQQTTILDQVNPRFLRPVILSTNGVQVIANSNNVVGINIGDIIEAAVTVDPHMTWPPVIAGQPANIFANQLSGSNVNISATVEFPTLTPASYIWQIAPGSNQSNWANITTANAGGLTNANISNWNTNAITFNPLNNASNFVFRCEVYSNSGTNNTNTMFVTTISPPANVTVAHPNAANFSVLVTSLTVDTFSYLWQISTDGGTTYTNLADNTIYAGSSTNFLTINNSTGLNGFRYRVGVSNGTSSPNSNNAVLTVT